VSLQTFKQALGLGSPDSSWTDEQLVQACLAGDETAWEALIQKYKRLIYAIPYRYGAKAEDAGDIFQLVCLELYSELPRLRKVESLKSWLITVCSRQSMKWRRKQGRHEGEEADLDREEDKNSLGGPEWLAAAERAQQVSEAMDRLSEQCRTLVRRLFFEEPPLPYEDLAKELGLATGSIGFTRGRCLEYMRKYLQEPGR
jgi:RNA polymerase sigma factor (sigma-70 family)